MAGQALRDIARDFAGRPSARVLAASFVAALGLRAALGRWGAADAGVALALVAAQPFVEWLVHLKVLHAKPFRVLGRVFDPGASHRVHHEDPRDLDHVVLDARYVAVGVAAAGLPVGWLAVVASPAWATFLTVAVAALLAYEWVHFLVHADHAPRSALYRRVRRAHLLHHYRDERYWLGVTSPVADVVLGTWMGTGSGSGRRARRAGTL